MSTERTRLVTQQSGPRIYTARRETDARTAILRGLAEYLEDLRAVALGGREIRLKQVFQTWADAEEKAVYPSAVVYSTGAATYDASRFTPNVDHKERVEEPDGRYVVPLAELAMDVEVELWCTDTKERVEVVAACEDAFTPFLYRYGLALELPHYYNMRASYEPKTISYLDNEPDVMRRHRRATFMLAASMPVVVLRQVPGARPRAIVDVVGSDVVLSPSVEVS